MVSVVAYGDRKDCLTYKHTSNIITFTRYVQTNNVYNIILYRAVYTKI